MNLVETGQQVAGAKKVEQQTGRQYKCSSGKQSKLQIL